MKAKARKLIAWLTIIVTLATQFTPAFADEENKSVKVNIGVPNIYTEVVYDEKTEVAIANDEGIAELPGLYSFLIDKGFSGDLEEPLSQEVVININYPGISTYARHKNGGNTDYQGITVNKELNSNSEWTEIDVSPLSKSFEHVGYVYKVPTGKGIEDAVPAGKVDVLVSENKLLPTEEDGFYATVEALPHKVRETEEYTEGITDDNLIIYIWEKFEPDEDMYTMSPAWVGEDTDKITVTANEGYQVSLDGSEFSESVEYLREDSPKVIIKDSIGHISRAFTPKYIVDDIAPRIVNLELAAEGVELKSHGIYGKKYAEFTVAVTIEENESGIDKVSLLGRQEYPSAETVEKDGIYTAVFRIENEKELFKDTLFVRATDRAGNVSETKLIRDNDNESTLTLEDIPPVIDEIEASKEARGVNGWYISSPEITIRAQDEESGLKSIAIYVNNEKIVEREYQEKTVDKEELKLTIPKSIIDKKPEGGIFEVKVVATDNSDVSSVATKIIKIDETIPILEVNGIEDGDILKEATPISIEAVEDNSYSIDARLSVQDISDEKVILSETYEGKGLIPSQTISENGIYTLNAKAIDDAGNESEEVEIKFTIDSEAPGLEEVGIKEGEPNEHGWYGSEITYQFKSYDIVSGIKNIKGYINDKEVTTSNHELKLSKDLYTELKTNEITFKVIAEDNAGNTSELSHTYNVDMDAATLTISGVENEGIYKDNPEIKLTSSEDLSKGGKITVKVNEKEYVFEKVTEASITDIEADGEYSISAYLEDRAGNITEETLVFVLDKTVPALVPLGIKDIKPNMNGWYNQGMIYTFTVSDELSGLKEVKAYINDKEVETKDNEVRLDEKDIQNGGPFTFRVTAEDNAGNKHEISTTYFADVKEPKVTLSNITPNGIYIKAPNLNIDVDDENLTKEGGVIAVAILKDGKEVERFDIEHLDKTSINKFEDDGKYEVKVIATDPAGNASKEETISFTVDGASPVIEDIGVKEGEPNKDGWYNKEITYEFKTSDNTSGIESISAKLNGDDVEIKDNTIEITKKLIEERENPQSTYTVEIEAVDKAGNKEIFARTFRIDLVKPSLSFEGASEGGSYKEVPFILVNNNEKHFSEDKAAVVISVERDGELIEEKTEASKDKISVTGFSEDGKYTITAYAKDAADNISDVAKLTFVKDSTPPSIKFNGPTTSPNTNGWYNGPISIPVSSSDETAGISSFTATVNGTEVPIVNGNIEITNALISNLDDGSGVYNIEVIARDESGNETRSTGTYKIDIVPPGVSISGIEDTVYREVPNITVSSNDAHSEENEHIIYATVIRDGSTVYTREFPGTASGILNSFSEDGNYIVRVYAIDAAGNRSAEREVSFTKDSTAPQISITGANANTWNRSTVNLTVSILERYYQDAEASVKLTRKINGSETDIPFPFTFNGENSSRSISLSDSGEYTIVVQSKDGIGNEAKEERMTFYLDAKSPTVLINGVENRIYGYDDYIAPTVAYTDEYLDEMTYSLLKGGIELKDKIRIISEDGRFAFSDIPKEKEYDGSYTLKVTVKDKAGNETVEAVNFIINRFGSFFKYTDSIDKHNNKYMKNIGSDLVINEFNVSDLVETVNEVKYDGRPVEAETKNEIGRSGEYIRTGHIFDKSNFEAEGVYEINVISKDSAGNSMESKSENGEVKFVIDRTAPTISLSKVDRYVNGHNLEVTITTSDNLSPTVAVDVTVNGNRVETDETQGVVTFTLHEGQDQDIHITARDLAGNVNEAERTVSVIPETGEYAVKKFKFPVIVAGAVFIACIILLAALKRSKDKGDEEVL